LNKAISASTPDLIVPCDDPATFHLHRLHSRLPLAGASATRLRDVLERSLGPAASHPIIGARSRLIEVARAEGIRVPPSAAIATMDDLRAWISQNGLPAVLKADWTSGGEGVQIMPTIAAAERAFARLSAPSTAVSTAKHALFERNAPAHLPSLPRRNRVLHVQGFIAGRDATSTVACWQGEVAASIHGEVLKTLYDRGPASVLRLIDHPEMDHCAGRLIRRLGLSGIYGFDFRLDARTGEAHFIEMNARATQISHLAMGTGRNLPVALHALLSGQPIPPTRRMTEKDIIVLFPQEWNRDPTSEFLQSGFHDVPWREPGLVKLCIDHFLPGSGIRVRARPKHLLHLLHMKTRERQRR
jgi:hypothetical protein